MKSIGLILKLRPGCYDEYKKRHDELWPEMDEAMKSFGLSTVIYRYEDLLFVYEQAPSEESFVKMGEHPITPRWNKHMSEVLQIDGHGEVIFITLPLTFSFGAFEQ